MARSVLIGVGLLAVAAGVGIWMMMQGTNPKQYDYLKAPRIIEKPDATVLEVSFAVKSEELSKVFGALFKTYFQLKGVPKGSKMSAPVARYENLMDLSMPPEKRKEIYGDMIWKGMAALPVPAQVRSLPAVKAEPGLTPRLGVWKYGMVAEILHKGPYEEETPTVNKLLSYVQAQGYEIAGLHEEEYLRGPGMLFSKPENYLTIIRYPVKKKSAK